MPTWTRAAAACLPLLLLACEPPAGSTLPQNAPARIVDLRTGEEVDFDALITDLTQAKAVYLGERHDREGDHRMQRAILAALHREDPALHVGLEMFQRHYQGVLDDWVAGRLDEAALRRRSEWDDRWGFDYALYRPIFELTRGRGIPMWALNATREVTRKVAREGLDSISPEERETLAELDLDDAAHRQMVREAFGMADASAESVHGGHGMDEATFERFYSAQVIWDETMAEGVAEALEHGASRVVVLAGAMHVRAGLGIPKRAARRGALPYRIVLVASTDEEFEALETATPRPADYVWSTAE